MNTGKRIAQLRKDKGFSQEYLAQKIGVSRQAVHKWEKELSSPDTQNLIALADVLGTSVDYIINGNMQPLCTPQKKRNKIFIYIYTRNRIKDNTYFMFITIIPNILKFRKFYITIK